MHMGDPIPESLIAVVEIFGGKETSSVPLTFDLCQAIQQTCINEFYNLLAWRGK